MNFLLYLLLNTLISPLYNCFKTVIIIYYILKIHGKNAWSQLSTFMAMRFQYVILYVLVCSFSHSYLHMDPVLDHVSWFSFVSLNKVSFLFWSSQWRSRMWVLLFVLPHPHNERLYFVFADIDCFLQTCLFCMVLHLASPFSSFLEPNHSYLKLLHHVYNIERHDLQTQRKLCLLALLKSGFWNHSIDLEV